MWHFECKNCKRSFQEGFWVICTEGPFVITGPRLLLVCERCMLAMVGLGIGFIYHRAVATKYYCASCETLVMLYPAKCIKTLEYGDVTALCPNCKEEKVFTRKVA